MKTCVGNLSNRRKIMKKNLNSNIVKLSGTSTTCLLPGGAVVRQMATR